MSIERAPNCDRYTDTVSVLVGSTHTSEGGNCRANVTAYSCQTKHFEEPDAATRAFLEARGLEELQKMSCDTETVDVAFHTNMVGARDIDYSGKELAERGMASNCFRAGNDPNETTHIVRAECTNQYEFLGEKNRRYRDTNKKFLGSLVACDVSEEAMPQIMEDARKVAAHNATANGYVVAKDTDLACTFSILPHL